MYKQIIALKFKTQDFITVEVVKDELYGIERRHRKLREEVLKLYSSEKLKRELSNKDELKKTIRLYFSSLINENDKLLFDELASNLDMSLSVLAFIEELRLLDQKIRDYRIVLEKDKKIFTGIIDETDIIKMVRTKKSKFTANDHNDCLILSSCICYSCAYRNFDRKVVFITNDNFLVGLDSDINSYIAKNFPYVPIELFDSDDKPFTIRRFEYLMPT